MQIRIGGTRTTHERWAHAATTVSYEKAASLQRELRSLAVPAVLERLRGGWAVLVPMRDLPLALGISGDPDPAIDEHFDPPSAEAVNASRLWMVQAAAVVFVSLGLGYLVCVQPPQNASHWTQSGRAFHADDDGDGSIDRIVVCGDDGQPTAVWTDRNHDGVMDRSVWMGDGQVVESLDEDGDGAFERRRTVFPGPVSPPEGALGPMNGEQ